MPSSPRTHPQAEGALAYERQVREVAVRAFGLRVGLGFYCYLTEHGRPSRRREVTFSVSWTGRPIAPRGFPADRSPNGGGAHA